METKWDTCTWNQKEAVERGGKECLKDITGYTEGKRIGMGKESYLLNDLYIDDKSNIGWICRDNYIAADVEFFN